MSDRCVIYCRVSSEEQIQGTSLSSQEKACRAFADRSGWIVDRVFVEMGESAKSADRTEFQAMIRYACVKARGISKVLVWKIDRFARQNYDYAVFQALLAGSGVQIVSATEPSSDGPAGKMMQSVLAVIAQFDNDVRAERTRTAMRSLSERGYWVHKAPLGYNVAKRDGKPVLVADPIAGPAVAKVFAEFAAGRMNVPAALIFLREAGVRSKSGAIVSPQALHAMLRQPVYAGRIQTELTRGASVPAQFEGLVSEQIWQDVQAVLGGRSVAHVPRKTVSDDFPLRGIIQCGCGSPFTASWSKGRSARYGYYHCPHGCSGSRARVETVHAQFRDLLAEISRTVAPLMAAFRHIVIKVHERRHAEVIEMQKQRRAKCEVLDRKAATLLDKLLDGTISDETYRARNAQLQTEIAVARVAAHEGEAEPFDTLAAVRLAEHMLSDLATIWDASDGIGRARFERALFPSGIPWSVSDGVRTAVSGSVFSSIAAIRFDNSQLAPHRSGRSNQTDDLEQLLKRLWAVRDLCVAA